MNYLSAILISIGIIGVIYKKRLCFLLIVLGALIAFKVLLDAKIYGLAGLQIFLIIINLFGCYKWKKDV